MCGSATRIRTCSYERRADHDLHGRRLLGNPGPGGWGAILFFKGTERELSGGEAMTTNNRMELIGGHRGAERPQAALLVHLFTDSQYVLQGITAWMKNWKRRGWRPPTTSRSRTRISGALLDEAAARHDVKWHWVKGTCGRRRSTSASTNWRWRRCSRSRRARSAAARSRRRRCERQVARRSVASPSESEEVSAGEPLPETLKPLDRFRRRRRRPSTARPRR